MVVVVSRPFVFHYLGFSGETCALLGSWVFFFCWFWAGYNVYVCMRDRT